MFGKIKVNPVLELEKKALNQNYKVMRVDGDGNFEYTEKIMFDFMNNIYEEGKNAKKPSKILHTVFFVLGLIIGAAAGVTTLIILLR